MKLNYFNGAHFIVMSLMAAVFCGIYFPLKNKSEAVKSRVILIVLIVNAVLFVAYKIVMGLTFDDFFILNELPLHLCNLNVILLPIAVKTKNRFLCAYLFYVGIIAALAAVVVFDSLFAGRNIFSFVVFIYFLYHSILLSAGVLIPALKIYNPKFTDIFRAMLTAVVLSLCMHTINSVFRYTNICVVSNYFYTYGLEGNPVLGGLYKLIPVPVLYQFPLLPVLLVLNSLMYLPFKLRNKYSQKDINTKQQRTKS